MTHLFVFLIDYLPANSLSKFILHSKDFSIRKKTLLLTLVLAIGIHSLIAMIFFQLAHLIGVKEMNLATQFFLMPIGLITVAIPIAPGGIGIGHVAFESLYQLAGLSGGADIFNLFIIVQLGVFLLGGIPISFTAVNIKFRRTRKKCFENPYCHAINLGKFKLKIELNTLCKC